MARPSEAKIQIEVERLALLQGEQRKLRARLTRELKVKKAGAHLPGEELLKKHTAVFLKIGVPGISYTDIAARLGETKGEVKKWFKEDPDVKEFYDWVLNNLKEGALSLMKTYSLEAVETLVLLMRFGSEKYMFEASRELLDRIGVPKVSRQEIDSEHTTKHKWDDTDTLVEQIRELSPELQEEAIAVVEKLQELLAQEANKTNGNKASNDGESGLKPINSNEDETDDDDDGDD